MLKKREQIWKFTCMNFIRIVDLLFHRQPAPVPHAEGFSSIQGARENKKSGSSEMTLSVKPRRRTDSGEVSVNLYPDYLYSFFLFKTSEKSLNTISTEKK